MATAQFEIEGKDLALAALANFSASIDDFSDCRIGRRNRCAGVSDAATFDRTLKGLPPFRLI